MKRGDSTRRLALQPFRLSVSLAIVVAAGFLAVSHLAEAQPQVFLPPNVLLPNGESLPVGADGGLEGNALTARANDSTAPWFNPAGLALTRSSSASVSAGTVRFVTVNPEGTNSSGGSIDVLPAAVGVVVKNAFGSKDWTLGFAIARTAAWRQETDFQFVQGDTLRQRTTLSADAQFNRTTVAIATGWAGVGAWRFGGGVLGDILGLRSVQSVSYRRETGTYVETALISNRAMGSQATIRLSLGAQADLSKNLKFGATLRTPGFRILPGGSFSGDIVSQKGAVSMQASFFDGETTDFKYKLPFEGALGLAWIAETFEVEVNVKGQSGVSAYKGFTSPNNVVFISDRGDGSPAQVTATPFPGRTFEGKGIVNFSIGGRVALDQKKIWKLHAGFATDYSPVGDSDVFFDRIDLNSVSIGVSGQAFHISGSLGLTYQFGTSAERPVPDLVGETLAFTKFEVSNFGILYSFSYSF